MVVAAAKSRSCGDLRPWSLRTSCEFEANPKKSLAARVFFWRPAKQKTLRFLQRNHRRNGCEPTCGHRGECDFRIRFLCKSVALESLLGGRPSCQASVEATASTRENRPNIPSEGKSFDLQESFPSECGSPFRVALSLEAAFFSMR